MLTKSPLFSMPAFSALSMDTLLLGVRDEHQAISIDNLPWNTCAEFTQKLFHHLDGLQWTMERALRHTKSHAKLLTVLTVYPLVTPGVHALGDTYSPFIETKIHQGSPQDILQHKIRGYIKSTKANYSSLLVVMHFFCS